jgi:uncharacterized iron-regulated membrane protein
MITPVRLLLVVVALGAAGASAYGLFVGKSLPITVSGAAVFAGAVFLIGLVAASATVRAGRDGNGRTAFVAALFGGLCMLAASGSLTVAILLGLLTSPS